MVIIDDFSNSSPYIRYIIPGRLSIYKKYNKCIDVVHGNDVLLCMNLKKGEKCG
jgi:hypothetical protein